MKKHSLADQLEIWGVEDNFTLFNDGSIGFGLELKPIDVSSSSDDFINQIAVQAKTFLNALPSELDIQFVQDIKAGNDNVISNYSELTKNSTNKVASELTAEKITKFKKMDSMGVLPYHGLKVFIRKPFSQKLVKQSFFLSLIHI